jgi:eukaryotic-like serine/threonine-protein kinase
MSLAAGTQLAHFEILAPLGAGGMGEVYRARDTRLNREVAIKVLPADFANDADRLRRFEQEAHATSALNHPNILTVYDIGKAASELGGAPYLVAELLEGEELRAQLDQGALPVRKAIEYAQQVAAGLAAAHAKGIVHRDLKPENLFVTKDGRVKILDFGLAKLKPQKLGGGVDSEAPTQNLMKQPLTNPGVVMGTVGYMSPEQVRGAEVDHRSDIFSFGIILHEMLSGRRTFTGDSLVELMNAILKDEPPELSETNAKISPALDKIVRRCLEKKPEQRFHSAHDLGFALSTLTTPSGSRLETAATLPALTESLPAAGKTGLLGNARLWMAAAAVAVLAALSFALAWWQRAPVEARTVRSIIALPENARSVGEFAISPDGRQVVARMRSSEGKLQLWVRALDALMWRALTSTEDARYPFWSPDSRSIGFFAEGKLKKIEVAGGPPLTLCEARNGAGGTWNQDGVIVFAPRLNGSLLRVSAAGGTASVVTKQVEPTDSHRFPSFLPDGQHFLYLARGDVLVASLDAPAGKTLLRDVSNALFAQGQLLFVRQATLFAHSFDTRRLELMGEAVPLAEPVRLHMQRLLGDFSVSTQGMLVYSSETEGLERQLIWFDRSGKQTGGLADPAGYFGLHLAPDGKTVAVHITEAVQSNESPSDIWLYDVARGARIRFTTDQKGNREAVWSPDGKRLIFSSIQKHGGQRDLYEKAADGTGGAALLVESDQDKTPVSWSADGRFILYQSISRETRNDLWVLPLTGDRKSFPILQTEFTENRGQFSPDGRWVVYGSDESREREVYVTAFPGPGGKRRVSTAGGSYPRWRRDGKEIFYLAPDNKLMAVEVNLKGTELEIGTARVLFEVNAYTGAGYPYDVTTDGQRFLFMTTQEQRESTPITLVQNWAAGVKK